MEAKSRIPESMEKYALSRGMNWINYGHEQFMKKHPGMTRTELDELIKKDRTPSEKEESQFKIDFKVTELKTLLSIKTILTQGHPTHLVGVGVEGVVLMKSGPEVPNLPFFKITGKFPVLARFSTFAGGHDDRSRNSLGLLLKFSDDPMGTQFDLPMITGVASPFNDFDGFVALGRATRHRESGNIEAFKKYLLSSPNNWYNMIDTTVSGLSSYMKVFYHSQFPLHMKSADGSEYYCKFRVVPYNTKEAIEGLLTKEEQETIWDATPKDDLQNLAENYLRKELWQRILDKKEAKMRLEIMTSRKTGTESLGFFHSAAEWEGCDWQDLADVYFNKVVPDEIMHKMSGNVGNLPQGLSIIQPKSSKEPNFINYCRSKVYPRIHAIRQSFLVTEENNAFKKMTIVGYSVVIQTGSMRGAGTDNDVGLVIFGTSGKTSKIKLDNFWQNDFENAQTDEFNIKAYDVGQIEYIAIALKPSLPFQDSWYINTITIQKNGGQPVFFPVYQWITQMDAEPLIVMTNSTTLPQKDSTNRQVARRLTLQKLPWTEMTEGLPLAGYYEMANYNLFDLDYNMELDGVKISNITRTVLSDVARGAFQKAKGLLEPIKSFDDYFDVAKTLKRQPEEETPANKHVKDGFLSNWYKNWKSDTEYGRQTLNGINPLMIERVTEELPEKFKVTNEHLDGLLQRGLSLAQEIAAGNMFLIDYEILDGINTGTYNGKKLHLPVPFCLFYLRPNDDLVPIAIQLTQGPDKRDADDGNHWTIWTPKDGENAWLLAKMWCRNADVHVQDVVNHLTLTHLTLEPFAVSMFNHLSPCHPLYKLLREHLRYCIAINTLGRVQLLKIGGAGDKCFTVGMGSGNKEDGGRPSGIWELVSKGFQSLTYDDFHILNQIEKRGVQNIPNYFWKDDSIALWNATSDYVSDMIDLFYKTKEDVKEDEELQDFVADLATNGFNSNGFGFPSSITNSVDLKDLATKIIFKASSMHAGINFELLEYSRFAPNRPGIMRGDIPTELDKKGVTEETILATLPTREQASDMVSFAHVLTRFSGGEVYLMPKTVKEEVHYPRWLFSERKMKCPERQIMDKFVVRLQKIENDINERNETLEIPYTVLKPSRIPAGCNI